MPKAIVKHLLGEFIVDQAGKIVKETLADAPLESQDPIPSPLLTALKAQKYRAILRDFNLDIVKQKIKASVCVDNFIGQAINSMADLERSANQVSRRLREWYALYNPEFTVSLQDNEKFAELVATRSKEALLADVKARGTMGADLKKEDLDPILDLAALLHSLFAQKNALHEYLERALSKHAPNLKAIAGTAIAAKLIEHTGSLKKLMLLPASTLQILGAEKALFRHLTTGARPPKFGYIMHHPFVAQAPREEKGRRARQLADKLAMAVKMDYFKGEFIADRLKKELEEKTHLPRSKKQAPAFPAGKHEAPSANAPSSKPTPMYQKRESIPAWVQQDRAPGTSSAPAPFRRTGSPSGEMRGFAPRKREERIDAGQKVPYPHRVFNRQFARQDGKPFPPRSKDERTEASPKAPFPGAYKRPAPFNRPQQGFRSSEREVQDGPRYRKPFDRAQQGFQRPAEREQDGPRYRKPIKRFEQEERPSYGRARRAPAPERSFSRGGSNREERPAFRSREREERGAEPRKNSFSRPVFNSQRKNSSPAQRFQKRQEPAEEREPRAYSRERKPPMKRWRK
ncbi:MAG: hypothetical protein Q7S65_01265 [Nanoarchaeota archaeon]|nr:hypothetical protein [Nanoarchaeota archaeon]